VGNQLGGIHIALGRVGRERPVVELGRGHGLRLAHAVADFARNDLFTQPQSHGCLLRVAPLRDMEAKVSPSGSLNIIFALLHLSLGQSRN
jgi:hypothetical protein